MPGAALGAGDGGKERRCHPRLCGVEGFESRGPQSWAVLSPGDVWPSLDHFWLS